MSTTTDQIRSFITEEILKGDDSGMTDELDLREAGVLTSLSTLKLVSFVEERFGVEVGVSDPRNRFTSVQEIARFVEERS
jgi:acyl carrier protein